MTIDDGVLSCLLMIVGVLYAVYEIRKPRKLSSRPLVKFAYKQGEDKLGRPTFDVTANNYIEAASIVDGWTYPGACWWVVEKCKDPNKWRIYLQDYR